MKTAFLFPIKNFYIDIVEPITSSFERKAGDGRFLFVVTNYSTEASPDHLQRYCAKYFHKFKLLFWELLQKRQDQLSVKRAR